MLTITKSSWCPALGGGNMLRKTSPANGLGTSTSEAPTIRAMVSSVDCYVDQHIFDYINITLSLTHVYHVLGIL